MHAAQPLATAATHQPAGHSAAGTRVRRSPEEADSQALRAAVLLDELDAPREGEADTRRSSIIVDLKVRWPCWGCSSQQQPAVLPMQQHHRGPQGALPSIVVILRACCRTSSSCTAGG